jgi:hypothetical protein
MNLFHISSPSHKELPLAKPDDLGKSALVLNIDMKVQDGLFEKHLILYLNEAVLDTSDGGFGYCEATENGQFDSGLKNEILSPK